MNKHEIKKIDFKEVLEQIIYDWGFDSENLNKDDNGNFYINKTYITPEKMTYKTETYYLNKDAFKKLESFWKLLNE